MSRDAVKTPTRSVMDDRIHALVILTDACRRLPDYSLGELLYAALRGSSVENGGDVRYLRRMDNRDLVAAIDRGVSDEFPDEQEE